MPKTKPVFADTLFQEVRSQIANEVIALVRDALNSALETYNTGAPTRTAPARTANRNRAGGAKKPARKGPQPGDTWEVASKSTRRPPNWVVEQTGGMKKKAPISKAFGAGAVFIFGKPAPKRSDTAAPKAPAVRKTAARKPEKLEKVAATAE